jgi:acyl CoA:acetate/3-ketoacid CoA transferase alpha subunit
VAKVDIGFIYMSRFIRNAIEEGKLKVIDWSNFAMTARQMAGAMGIPFIPTRNLLGTDTFRTSGAKIVKDPFTGKPVCLLPALFSDVALIHVHQCDIYGNARIFGPGLDPLAVAFSSKKVIVSTEEIIDPEEIRINPGKTTLPYYCVDAVVEAPFGVWPGTMPGRYALDPEGWAEMFGALNSEESLREYMEKYIYSVSSHLEMLEQRVGAKRLAQNMVKERNREGYY